ncbi:MAG: PDZ domain-containing protein [Planctomycetales bacterium]|nr:PDZ domain-containing protein [Planctomycetales bacterium]
MPKCVVQPFLTLRFFLAITCILGCSQISFGQPNEVHSYSPVDGSKPISVSDEYLQTKLDELSSDSYRARQAAYWQLSQHPSDTVRIIGLRIDKFDYNTTQQIIELLSLFATHEDPRTQRQAYELLQQLAERVSGVGILAQNVVLGIADIQEAKAIEHLNHYGVMFGDRFFMIDGKRPRFNVGDEYSPAMVLSSRFIIQRKEILDWIPFVKSVDTVYIIGEFDRPLLESVSKMRGVKNVKLREIKLTAADLDLFREFYTLEHFELSYVDIDDSCIETLLSLPINISLRLYGTNISDEGAEKLARNLSTIQVFCARGGHLGVSMDLNDTVVLDVAPNSAALLGGIQRSDVLTHIANVPISNFDELRRELGKFRAAETIEIRLKRPVSHFQKEEVTLHVTLGYEAE